MVLFVIYLSCQLLNQSKNECSRTSKNRTGTLQVPLRGSNFRHI